MEEIAESEKSETGAKANGFRIQMETFEFFFQLSLLCKIFGLVDTVNIALQGKSLHFQQAFEMISTLLKLLKEVRTQYESFWEETNAKAEVLGISQSKLPRRRRIAHKLDDASNRNISPFNTPKDIYLQIYNEVVDTVIQSITTRFKSQVFEFMIKAELFLIGVKKDVDEIKEHFKDDVDGDKLVLHRDMLLDIMKTREEKVENVASVVDFLQKNSQIKDLLPELKKFLRLLLTLPVSTATAERSFSSLRRLKTYLRSTMTQRRLNHISILNVHREETNCLNMDFIANEFITRAEIRKSTFAMR